MQILGYYQQLSKRFTCFVIVQYWRHPYIDKVHNINKNLYAKYQIIIQSIFMIGKN